MTNEAKALVVVSSVTGNTRVVGHWLADAYAAGVLYTPETAPLTSRASAPCFWVFGATRGMRPKT